MGPGCTLSCSGVDSRKFIQGLTTNDMNALRPDNPVVFAAILSPKVKKQRRVEHV
jgi:folate-binding Fe-S cluster repair protein YgfZ